MQGGARRPGAATLEGARHLAQLAAPLLPAAVLSRKAFEPNPQTHSVYIAGMQWTDEAGKQDALSGLAGCCVTDLVSMDRMLTTERHFYHNMCKQLKLPSAYVPQERSRVSAE